MAERGGGLGRGFPKDRAALVCYLMAGYPDRATSLLAVRAAVSAGADVVELGVPYADPLADGPVIAQAAKAARAAEGGFGLAETIGLAREIALSPDAAADVPIALMTYFNPMLKFGLSRLANEALEAGVSGFIVPDLPPDSAGEWLAVSPDLDTVFLAAPTSTPERLSLVGSSSRGFVYCVSTTGVTGERSELPSGIDALVARVKEATTLPVAVGFGVSTPAQAAALARIADGVVVGSALVRLQADPAALGSFVAELASAVRASV